MKISFYVISFLILFYGVFCANFVDIRDDKNSSSSSADTMKLKKDRKDMYLRIQGRIKAQLGIEQVKDLRHYDIQGWPPFISFHHKSWDTQILQKIEWSLESFVFAEKSIEPKSRIINDRKSELKALLLARFKAQTGLENITKIQWRSHNLRGWPAGVSLSPALWRFKDVSAIFNQLDAITWEPLLENEDRTITYSDGKVETINARKKNAKRKQSDEAAENEMDNETNEQNNKHFEYDIDDLDFTSIDYTSSFDSFPVSPESFASLYDCSEKTSFTSSSENNDFDTRRAYLLERLKTIARTQLGLSSVNSFKAFEIEGWPEFVSLQSFYWDEQAIKDLNDSIDSLVFRKKTENERKEKRPSPKQRILALLLETLRNQMGDQSIQFIPWKFLNIKGWPPGVSLVGTEWTASDMLAIFHHLNEITWERRSLNEDRTVIYSNGICKILQPKRSSLFDAINFEDETLIDEDDNDEGTIILDAIDAEEHLQKCKEMNARVRSIAGNQLKTNSGKELNHYEIENWPPFISLKFEHWDQQALAELEAVLPTLIFKRKQTNSGVSNRKTNKIKLSALLLEKFQLQQGIKRGITIIPWQRYHVHGWPRDVPVYCNFWSEREILFIYRNIQIISWQPVLPDEIRTVFYSDGTCKLLHKTTNKYIKNGSKRLKIADNDADSTELNHK